MIIVVCGMQRSASTWSYNVCRDVARRAGLEIDPSSGQYGSEDMVAKVAEGVAPNAALLLRNHWLDPAMLDLIKRREVHAVYTVRDPRDVVASILETFGNNFKNAVRDLERSLTIMEALKAGDSALVLRFPDIMAAPERMVSAIADYLGLPIPDDDAQAIADALSRDKLRRKSTDLSPENQKIYNGFSYDSDTLLLDNHIRLERPADWKEHLSESQGRFLSWHWRDSLDWLGTPPRQGEMGSWTTWPERLYYLARLRLWEQRG